MGMKLSSFIFKRMNVRNSEGDIAFFRLWVDRWEEEREPVSRESLILHFTANYSPEMEKQLLGNRRGLIEVPVDMIVSRSLLDILDGTKFILNLLPPRKALTAKHRSMLRELFDYHTSNGFLFSIHEDLLGVEPDFVKEFDEFITYVYGYESYPRVDGKLLIACGEFPPQDYDFICEGEFEDVLIVNSLRHTQAAVSKLISMISEDPSIDELAETIKCDPALVTKLLQYVNSPLFPHRKEIESITSAINYLGLENLKKFLIAVWMSQFFGQDPSFLEFIKRMLFNAFLLESLHKYVDNVPKDKLFLLGLFYKMPEAFGVRPQVLFQSLQLPEEIVKLYEEESLKRILKILDLLETDELEDYLRSLGIDPEAFKEKNLKYAEENISTLLS